MKKAEPRFSTNGAQGYGGGGGGGGSGGGQSPMGRSGGYPQQGGYQQRK